MTPLKKRCEIDIILNLLVKGYTRPKILKKLNIKASALSNHLRRLEDAGCIERKGKFIIKVLRSSYSTLWVSKDQVHKKLNKRGHAHNFKIIFPMEKNLIEKPKVQQEYKAKIIEKLQFGSMKLIKNKYSIWINKGSLTIYSNHSYYSKDAMHTRFRALKDVDNLARDLKDRYGFIGRYGIEIFREHYGLIFNKFASWILKKGQKLYVQNRGNKTILWVDSSRKDDIGLEEFEGDNPMMINSADNFFNSHEQTGWRNNAYVTEKNTKDIENQKQVINKSMKVLEGYAEQIALHLRVEQKQEQHLADQTQLFKEIRDFLKNEKRD